MRTKDGTEFPDSYGPLPLRKMLLTALLMLALVVALGVGLVVVLRHAGSPTTDTSEAWR